MDSILLLVEIFPTWVALARDTGHNTVWSLLLLLGTLVADACIKYARLHALVMNNIIIILLSHVIV